MTEIIQIPLWGLLTNAIMWLLVGFIIGAYWVLGRKYKGEK
jgi:hypothetical protein